MKLSELLASGRELSVQGNVGGWFELALRYLAAQDDRTLPGWWRAAIGRASRFDAAALAELDHVGLTFCLPPRAVTDFAGAAHGAGLTDVVRFPSVLLARALAQHAPGKGGRVEVLKAQAPASLGDLRVEALLITRPDEEEASPLMRAAAGPLLHVAFRASSADEHRRQVESILAEGYKHPAVSGAYNPHEGLYSSYFDGDLHGSPLRLELCYACPPSADHERASI